MVAPAEAIHSFGECETEDMESADGRCHCGGKMKNATDAQLLIEAAVLLADQASQPFPLDEREYNALHEKNPYLDVEHAARARDLVAEIRRRYAIGLLGHLGIGPQE